MTAVATAKPKVKTLGALIDALHAKREAKRVAAERLKILEDEFDTLELEVITRLRADETTKGAGKRGSASISYSTVPSKKDEAAFWAYVHRHKAYHLVQCRPSAPACREIWERGKEIPGLDPFTKVTLHLGSIN